jgi:hypothetical protein
MRTVSAKAAFIKPNVVFHASAWDAEATEKAAPLMRRIEDYVYAALSVGMFGGEIAEDVMGMFPSIGTVEVVVRPGTVLVFIDG